MFEEDDLERRHPREFRRARVRPSTTTNCHSPRLSSPYRYIETVMIPQHIKSKMIEAGVEFAETEDAVKAVMRIATDSSVNGKLISITRM